MSDALNTIRQRLSLIIIGAIAGFFFWFQFEHLPDIISNQHVQLLIGVFAGTVFGGLLLMIGALRYKRALIYAGVIGSVTALLTVWASYRFSDVPEFLDAMHFLLAFSFLVWVPLPFVMAQETSPTGWRDYEALFDRAWSNFVRVVTASIFTSLFWAVLYLSDALLSLVGFPYLGDFMGVQWVAMTLTGGALGLAIAVLNELDTVVLTLRRLALQLLRLLVPPVMVVVLLFIVMLPVQGLGLVFWTVSAAGTMMIMALVAVTLVTSAVDARDRDGVRSRLMTLSARALSVLLPVIMGIAIYAIWVRVAQYGWTPPRLSGAVIAAVLFAYALAYAVSVVRPKGWRARIRKVNTALAGGVVGVSVLWMTPVLNVERISANSQVSRFVAGKTDVNDLDLWSLGHDWGNPGRAALGRVKAIKGHAQQAALKARLITYVNSKTRWDFEHPVSREHPSHETKKLKAMLPVMPTGATLPVGMLDALRNGETVDIITGCEAPLDDGRPGCVAVVGSFDPAEEGTDLVVIWINPYSTTLNFASVQKDKKYGKFISRKWVSVFGPDPLKRPAKEVIAKILDGGASFQPAHLNALEIDGSQILPQR